MKTEKELNKDILDITLSIQANHPELMKYIDEMSVTIPDTAKPEINVNNLSNYYDSLQALLKKYVANHRVDTQTYISSTFKLIIAVFICLFVGFVSGLSVQVGQMTWYDTLSKPAWSLPAYLFNPMWTCLYSLMGIALWLVWNKPAPEARKTKALAMFTVQLFLGLCWSLLFFRFHSLGLAYFNSILLLVSALITMFWFADISRYAALFFFPYVAWVFFTSALNYSVWTMNI
jgi:translocator protein